MQKEDMIKGLKAKKYDGKIEEINDDNIIWMSHHTFTEVWYQFPEACTDDYVKGLIHIGKGAREKGLTEDYIIAVLKKAFGDDYYDAVCTLAGIVIPSEEDEFYKMSEEANRTSDDMREWYDFDDDDKCVGLMGSNHQIVFVNEWAIARIVDEMSIYEASNPLKAYEIGIVTTLIHEMRHLMLDTNLLVKSSEDEASEEGVENFTLSKYESLGNLQLWK